MNPGQFRHTHSQLGVVNSPRQDWKGVRLTRTPPPPWDYQGGINEGDFSPHVQVWLLDNYFSTTAFNKRPIWRPRPFVLQLEEATVKAGGAGAGEAGDRASRKPGGSDQRPKWCLGCESHSVSESARAQRLTSSPAGLCLTSAHLSEIFFQPINYYSWALHPGSGEPLASYSKNQSSFTTFTLAEFQAFI